MRVITSVVASRLAAACLPLLLGLLPHSGCADGDFGPAPLALHSSDHDSDRDDDEDDIAVDAPENEAKFNREIWESIKRTTYAQMLAYVARAQRESAARQDADPDAATLALPTGWKIAPAGTTVAVGRLPYEAVAFAGRIVVLNNGFYKGKKQPDVSVVDPATNTVERTLHFGALFPSARVGLDGDLYISGGFSKQVYRIDRHWVTVRTYAIPNGYAGGLAPIDATHLAVATLVSSDTPEHYQKGNYAQGRLAILNTVSGRIEQESMVGYFPYALQFANGKLYAAVLGENKIAVFDRQLEPLKTVEVGASPQAITADGDRLYVANANGDTVSVIDDRTDAIVATIDLRYPGTRFGGAPTSCAVDAQNIYVSLANINAVAVVDKASYCCRGYIPTGWYATKALVDAGRLYMLSAKGIRPRRPDPLGTERSVETSLRSRYVLALLQGTLTSVSCSVIPAHLAAWTRQVEEGSPLFSSTVGLKLPLRHIFYIVRENRTYDQILGDLPQANGDPSLTEFGRDTTPNAHRLSEQFVTLDDYYTDAEISALGHSFTTSGYASPFLEWLANTSYSGRYKAYPYGSVPAVTSPEYLWDALDAHHVDYRIYGENYFLYTRGYNLVKDAFGADSPIAQKFYAQMMVLAAQADRGRAFSAFANTYYPQTTTPEAAYALLGKPEFTRPLSQFLCGDDSLVTVLAEKPDLRQKFAEYLFRYPANYRSWDLKVSDLDRFAAWKTDFDAQLKRGRVAQLQYIWLPNDHTAGAGPHPPLLPQQFVAQNDAALGRMIQTIAESSVWKDSLILVTEDDAQDGGDHVDATRTVCLAIGPWVRRNAIVHDRYDQLSLLRTIELILGLDPMNRNDALAAPMFGVFSPIPDFAMPTPPTPSAQLTPDDLQRFQAR